MGFLVQDVGIRFGEGGTVCPESKLYWYHCLVWRRGGGGGCKRLKLKGREVEI